MQQTDFVVPGLAGPRTTTRKARANPALRAGRARCWRRAFGKRETCVTTIEATTCHIRGFFSGHRIAVRQWTLGPAVTVLPDLRVLEIGPGPRMGRWTYVTAGAWDGALQPLEFMIIGDKRREAYVELLTMIAYYARDHRLGLGHVIPIGRPLVSGSACEYVYLSLPYTFGPELEVVHLPDADHRILWVFPITPPERSLLLEQGPDPLEAHFEAKAVEYWSPFRLSVI